MKKYMTGSMALAVLLLLSVILFYNSIISPIPVVRGYVADKTLFLSLRVLVINILTLCAFGALARSIGRSHKDHVTKHVGIVVVLLIDLKMVLEFIGLFSVKIMELEIYPLLLAIILVLVIGYLHNRVFFTRFYWKSVRFTRNEKIFLVLLLVAYLLMTLPAFSMVRS